jgi:nucleotide-binding universal stress UspA family protein
MSSIATIVCGVDFSDHSKVALGRAGAWAKHFRARLIVVTVAEPLLVSAAATTYDMDLVREEVLPELRDFVVKTSASGGAEIPSPEVVVLVGDPATEIIGLARREHAQLIVVATHGLSGYRKMLMGSTTERILRQTTVPVLVSPPPEQTLPSTDSPTIAVGRVLAPVDFKDDSVTDVGAAAALARSLGVPLLLVHVVAPLKGLERLRPQLDTHNRVQIERAEQQIQRLASEVGAPGSIETVVAVAVGSAAEEIARLAVARGAGLIVMGLRNPEHIFGPRPGSVAYRVLSLAPASVLALPPGVTDVEWLHAPKAAQS